MDAFLSFKHVFSGSFFLINVLCVIEFRVITESVWIMLVSYTFLHSNIKLSDESKNYSPMQSCPKEKHFSTNGDYGTLSLWFLYSSVMLSIIYYW